MVKEILLYYDGKIVLLWIDGLGLMTDGYSVLMNWLFIDIMERMINIIPCGQGLMLCLRTELVSVCVCNMLFLGFFFSLEIRERETSRRDMFFLAMFSIF